MIPAGRVGRITAVLSGIQSLAAVVLCQPELPGFVLWFSIATLAALCSHLVLSGRRDDRQWVVHVAGVFLLLLYAVIRTQTVLVLSGPWNDVIFLLGGAAVLFWVGHSSVESRALRVPMLVVSYYWPALCLLLLPALGPGQGALVALLAALHYAAMARTLQVRHLGVPAMLFGNLALFLSYSVMGWGDLMLYALPISVTLLGLVHVYTDELGPSASRVLRTIVLLGLYTLGTGRALLTLDPVQTLVVVPGLCVGGIIIGTLLRVRIYVLAGVGFLAADLVLNMVHYGLARPHLGALFLTVLGLVLVAGMVVFSLERERILKRYSAIFNELRTWD